MEGKEITRYTPEQLEDAEQMAKILSSVPEDKESIFIAMTNVFISGMEAGFQLLQKEET